MPVTRLVRGQALGSYVVLGQLGAGGMGVVYKAYDAVLGREVAIKLLRTERAPGAARSTELLDEAKKLARLAHPNVVTVYSVGNFLGQDFIAMEFIGGGTLGDWLKTSPPWREVLGCFLKAGEGLAAAHEQGIVHRDFKPDNVLLDAGHEPHVTDFGLAREGEIAASTPHAGVVAGTVGFLAPEQARRAVVNGRSDQFSYCVSLHLGLYGELPFPKDADLLNALPAVRPAPNVSRIPAWLRKVLLKGLSENPADRFHSMRALLEALRADPAQARRERLIQAGAVLLIGALAALGYFFSQRETREQRVERECVERVAGQFTKLWSPERQQKIQDAFGPGVGADTWTRAVQQRLSPEIAEWNKSSREACAVHGDPLARSRWIACLEERRKTLQGLSDLFERPDATVLQNAVSTLILEVSPASMCRQSGPSQEQAPSLSSDADEEMRSGLARARLFRASGKYEEGIEEAKHVADVAHQNGGRHVEAEALLLEGELYNNQHRLEHATGSLRAAILAADRVGDDEVRARASIVLISVYAADKHTWKDARDAAQQAGSILERLGNPPPLVAARFNAAGALEALTTHNTRLIQSDFENAILALRDAGVEEDHPLLVQSKTGLGFSSPLDAGVAMLREVLQARVMTFGPDHPETARARQNLGVKFLEESELQHALENFQAALEIRSKFPNADQDLGKTHAAIAKTLKRKGDLEGSLNHLELAVGLLKSGQATDEMQARELLNLLELKKRMHRPAGELDQVRKSMEEAGVTEPAPDTDVSPVSPPASDPSP